MEDKISEDVGIGERGRTTMYDKTDFGADEVEIPVQSSYEGGVDGVKGKNIRSMRPDQFGHFVADELERVFTTRQSTAGKSLQYYIAVGEGGEILGSKTANHLKSLARELDSAESYEEREKILEEVTTFLRGLRIRRG